MRAQRCQFMRNTTADAGATAGHQHHFASKQALGEN
jgi:hypothetical protein